VFTGPDSHPTLHFATLYAPISRSQGSHGPKHATAERERTIADKLG
jgi:hypothetical protein